MCYQVLKHQSIYGTSTANQIVPIVFLLILKNTLMAAKQLIKAMLASLFVCLLAGSTKAQNIDRIEYFFDADPGFGSGQTIGITAAPSINDLNTSVSIASLSNGLHTLYARSHSSNGHWSLSNRWLFLKLQPNASNVNKLEYFIDNDPGFGNGTDVAITAGATVSDVVVTPGIGALSLGLHTIYVRSKDDAGHWSITNRWLFLKAAPATTTVNKLEYFIDTDPGFGNGTNIPITAAASVNDVTASVNISSLPLGLHTIYVRSKDDAGNWSITNRWLFLKAAPTAATINKLEYFIDSDPGFGSGIDVPITPAASVNDVTAAVNISSLSSGLHTIYVRSKDDAGHWSITNRWLFLKSQQPSTNVNKLEYFVDTDPGFGNGTNIPVTAAASVSDVTASVNISNLSLGLHTIYVRSKNDAGHWSITNRWLFLKSQQPATDVDKLEYFVDMDPGFGNGTNIPITAAASVNDVTASVDISSLSLGLHNVYVRSKDNTGNWSITNRWLFLKSEKQGINMRQMEYFIDSDPGFGNGTAVDFVDPNGLSIDDLVFNVNISAFPNGIHRFYSRTLDSLGRWSITNFVQFDKQTVLPVRWLSFTAAWQNKKVLLQWQTASEQNSSHFDIEFSKDGIYFSSIGQVQAAGNSNTISNYSLLHALPLRGANYYRIRQVDRDGQFSYSEIRKLVLGDELPSMVLLNNPSNGSPVLAKTNETKAQLSVFDMSGRKRKEIMVSGAITRIAVDELAAGTYTVVLHKEGKIIATDKFVVSR
jgi:hypothetical protein